MADGTEIEWTDATWNPITGCSVISPGCTNCYAMRLAGTRMKHHWSREGLTDDSKAGPVWNGQVRFNEKWILQPLGWSRPRLIFVCAHADLFHEGVPRDWLDYIFAVMALAPQHTFQVLTKRPARMLEYLEKACGRIADRAMEVRKQTGIGRGSPVAPLPHVELGRSWWPLPNVWLGVSAENQASADYRIPLLLEAPAAVRWISAEPLLGSVELRRLHLSRGIQLDALRGTFSTFTSQLGGFATVGEAVTANERLPQPTGRVDWVVAGGESGPAARPVHPDWIRSLRDQCMSAGVAFNFKQWGEWETAIDRQREDPDWRADYSHKYANEGRHKWLNLAGGIGFHGDRFHVMRRVGKKAAGRLLDGVVHDEFPGGRQ